MPKVTQREHPIKKLYSPAKGEEFFGGGGGGLAVFSFIDSAFDVKLKLIRIESMDWDSKQVLIKIEDIHNEQVPD